jgi:hypothetical protein
VDPPSIFGVAPCAEFPALHATDVINEYVMELNSSGGIGENPVKDTGNFDGFDLESCLFEDLAGNSLLECLTQF